MLAADPQSTAITQAAQQADVDAESLIAAALKADPALTPFDLEIVREATATGHTLSVRRRPGLPKKITGV